MKKVLAISSSPRRGGNSDKLADAFCRGAAESGNSVSKVRLSEKNIGYCDACRFCRSSGGVCKKADDMQDILSAIIDADVILLATPLYFYSVSAQLKTAIDRCYPRWRDIKNKDFYFIVTAAEKDPECANGALATLRGFLDCCEGSVERAAVFAGGMYDIASEGSEYEAKLYEIGKNLK